MLDTFRLCFSKEKHCSNSLTFAFLLEFPAVSAVLWQLVGVSFGQLVPFWGAQGPLQGEVKLLRLHCERQILFSVLAQNLEHLL